ncbi:MAG: SIR2 family NAD-dependent protein deacylase [Bacteroidota bacterium]
MNASPSGSAITEAAELISNARHLLAFTGAGISVESGVPPFRGENGIWNKYDPEVLDIEYFSLFPERSWKVIREIFYEHFRSVEPNPAHYFLAQLQKTGLLKALITQNIDNLHQKAGSTGVIEYHGNSFYLRCTHCGKKFESSEFDITTSDPRCPNDQTILKPDFVFFGEAIPEDASVRAMEEALRADVLLVIGSTGEVYPAGALPKMARNNGARIIEINPQRTTFTHSVTHLFLQGKAGEICTELGRSIKYPKAI